MIEMQYQTPSVYYDLSRDFQYLGRLYEVVLNYLKTNSDIIYRLPNVWENDSKLVSLLMYSIGFKPKHNYETTQLLALGSIFVTLLKNKGTLAAIELAGNTILNAAGEVGSIRVEVKDGVVRIYVMAGKADVSLFNDILEYILPAGVSVSIIKSVANPKTTNTEIDVISRPEFEGAVDIKTSYIKAEESNALIYNPEILLDKDDNGVIGGIAALGTIITEQKSSSLNLNEGESNDEN